MDVNTKKVQEISELYHSHQYVYRLVQHLLERPQYLSPAQEIFGFFPKSFLIYLLQVLQRLNVKPGRHAEAKIQCDGDYWGGGTDHLQISKTETMDGNKDINWQKHSI